MYWGSQADCGNAVTGKIYFFHKQKAADTLTIIVFLEVSDSRLTRVTHPALGKTEKQGSGHDEGRKMHNKQGEWIATRGEAAYARWMLDKREEAYRGAIHRAMALRVRTYQRLFGRHPGVQWLGFAGHLFSDDVADAMRLGNRGDDPPLKRKRPFDERYGRRVAEVRDARGMTQQQLAEAIGAHVTTVANYERGRIEIKMARLEQIARALSCELADLWAPLGSAVPASTGRGPEP